MLLLLMFSLAVTAEDCWAGRTELNELNELSFAHFPSIIQKLVTDPRFVLVSVHSGKNNVVGFLKRATVKLSHFVGSRNDNQVWNSSMGPANQNPSFDSLGGSAFHNNAVKRHFCKLMFQVY